MAKSNAAIVSKALTMYGRRLKQEDWESLLNCKSVPEAAAYLKANTVYGDVLADIQESNIHRGELEDLLRTKLTRDVARLSIYDRNVGKGVGHFLIGMQEIRMVMRNIVRVDAHRPTPAYSAAPLLRDSSRLNIYGLEQATTFAQIMEALKGSAYYKEVEPFYPADGDFKDYTGLENALYTDLYNALYDAVEHHSTPIARQQLHGMLDDYIDLENYSRILRLKSYYHVPDQKIRQCLLPFGSISKKKLLEMATADTTQQVTAIMGTTRVGKRTLRFMEDTADQLKLVVRYKDAHKNLVFSTQSGVVMLSYVYVMDTEMQALIHLIEGIRYKIPPAQIRRLLSPYHFL